MTTTSPSTTPQTVADTRARVRRKSRTDRSAYIYVLPAVLIFSLLIALPSLHTLYLSFVEWDGLTAATSAGFDNYLALVQDPLLIGALKNAIVLLFFFTLLPIVLALLVTGLIGPKPRLGLTALRTIYFLPQVVPLVAVGIIWRWMYNSNGIVDSILGSIGIMGPIEGWLGNFATALPAMGLVGTWALYGVCLTLFLTGVQKVDVGLYDAVTIDGGGRVWQFFAVTLPSLRREIALAASITGIAALATFDLIYIATRGGPGNSTVVPGLLVYRLAFTNGEIGAASALAICLMVITGLYVVLVNTIDRSGVDS